MLEMSNVTASRFDPPALFGVQTLPAPHHTLMQLWLVKSLMLAYTEALASTRPLSIQVSSVCVGTQQLGGLEGCPLKGFVT